MTKPKPCKKCGKPFTLHIPGGYLCGCPWPMRKLKLKEAMPICLKHNMAHKTKYPYKSCYYNEDLKGGAKGVLGKSEKGISASPEIRGGTREAEQEGILDIPNTPAKTPKRCKLQSCGWNHGGECRCPGR